MLKKYSKIKVYGDGFDLKKIKLKKFKNLDGYTFNPSLFRKMEVKEYLKFCKKLVSTIKNKPISLEVIADSEFEMIRQAKILGQLSKNVYIKIPIVYTNGKSTYNVIKHLLELDYKLNITAIFSYNQVKNLSKIINNHTILSIFAGRLYDIGVDAEKEILKIKNLFKDNKIKPKFLWASPRMSYDIIKAQRSGCHIITMTSDLIEKLILHNKSKDEYSRETVKMFYNDAKLSKYNF